MWRKPPQASCCTEALIYDSLRQYDREEEMTQAMGYVTAAQRLANLIAFGLGGLLAMGLTLNRFRLAIGCTAVAVSLGWLFTFTLREPVLDAEPEGIASGSIDLLRQSVERLRTRPDLRRLALLSIFTIPFANYLINLYQPRFVAAKVPAIWLGLALAIGSGLSIVGARYAYRIMVGGAYEAVMGLVIGAVADRTLGGAFGLMGLLVVVGSTLWFTKGTNHEHSRV